MLVAGESHRKSEGEFECGSGHEFSLGHAKCHLLVRQAVEMCTHTAMGSFGNPLHLEGWGVWSSFHSVGRGGRPGKEKDNEKREPEVWRTRRGSCVQHQGGEHGRQWQLAEWACVEEGVMGDTGGL